MFKIRTSKNKISSRKISASSLSKNSNKPPHIGISNKPPQIGNPMPSPTANLANIKQLEQFDEAKKYYKGGNLEEALPLFELLVKKEPKNSDYLYHCAMVHLNQKNYRGGLDLLERICRNDPAFKKSMHLFAAISAKNLGLLAEALDYCRKGL